MDARQYNELRGPRSKNHAPVIACKDAQFCIPTRDGTLLYGFNSEFDRFHVYLKDNKLHRLIYSATEDKIIDYICGDELKAEDLCPDKHTCPEATSYEFMVALLKVGQKPSLTRFDNRRLFSDWYGKTHEDFKG